MKVLPDTNVLASAFGTRGLCADVLRLILGEHEPVLAEVVLRELHKVLRTKFAVPAATVKRIDEFLRGYHVETDPAELPRLNLRDRNDSLVVGSALGARVDIVVSGDREMLALKKVPDLRIINPREFWNLMASEARKQSKD